MNNLRNTIRGFIRNLDPFTTSTRMILLYGLLYGEPNWYFTLPFTFLACLGLLYDRALHSELFWFVLLVVVTGACILDWYVDGHLIFLLGYACLCVFITHLSNDRSLLPKMFRVLIGATFLMAVIAKMVSPDFLTGNFLYLAVLRDEAFRIFTGFSISSETVLQNRDLMPGRYFGSIVAGVFSLQTSDNLLSLVRILSRLLFAWELLIAIVFVFPTDTWVARNRDYFLGVFLISVYTLLPVPSFATILSALGFLQAERLHARTTYLVVFFLAQLHFFRLDLIT